MAELELFYQANIAQCIPTTMTGTVGDGKNVCLYLTTVDIAQLYAYASHCEARGQPLKGGTGGSGPPSSGNITLYSSKSYVKRCEIRPNFGGPDPPPNPSKFGLSVV